MRFRNLFAWAVGVTLASSPLRAQDGDYLFKTYCAICHEAASGEEARGPSRDVLRQMTPEHILQVLETGAMKAQAAERSRTQRRGPGPHLSGKPLGSQPVDRNPTASFC